MNLDYTDIVSPVDGVVVSRSVNVGQTVAASFQTPVLFLIAEDLTKMQINTNVSESNIGMVGERQKAFFTIQWTRTRNDNLGEPSLKYGMPYKSRKMS